MSVAHVVPRELGEDGFHRSPISSCCEAAVVGRAAPGVGRWNVVQIWPTTFVDLRCKSCNGSLAVEPGTVKVDGPWGFELVADYYDAEQVDLYPGRPGAITMKASDALKGYTLRVTYNGRGVFTLRAGDRSEEPMMEVGTGGLDRFPLEALIDAANDSRRFRGDLAATENRLAAARLAVLEGRLDDLPEALGMG